MRVKLLIYFKCVRFSYIIYVVIIKWVLLISFFYVLLEFINVNSVQFLCLFLYHLPVLVIKEYLLLSFDCFFLSFFYPFARRIARCFMSQIISSSIHKFSRMICNADCALCISEQFPLSFLTVTAWLIFFMNFLLLESVQLLAIKFVHF